MQLELPFAVESRGPSDFNAPTQRPPGRLRQVQLSARVISYWFRRARRRSIGIVVDERGLLACAPRWVTVAEVESFIREKERWVLKRLDDLRRRVRAPFTWREGAAFPYLGRPIALARGPAPGVRLVGDRLHIPAIDFDASLRESALGWLKCSALALYRERIAAFAAAMKVSIPEVALTNAASQWGSCVKRCDGGVRVLLHWKLVHFDRRLVDYVIAHELAHLRHMNHSAAFWRVVESAYPDPKSARRELREQEHLIPDL